MLCHSSSTFRWSSWWPSWCFLVLPHHGLRSWNFSPAKAAGKQWEAAKISVASCSEGNRILFFWIFQVYLGLLYSSMVFFCNMLLSLANDISSSSQKWKDVHESNTHMFDLRASQDACQVFRVASVFQQAFTQFVALALHFDMTMRVFGWQLRSHPARAAKANWVRTGTPHWWLASFRSLT